MAVLIAHNMDVRVFAQIAFPVAGAGNYRTAVAVGVSRAGAAVLIFRLLTSSLQPAPV